MFGTSEHCLQRLPALCTAIAPALWLLSEGWARAERRGFAVQTPQGTSPSLLFGQGVTMARVVGRSVLLLPTAKGHQGCVVFAYHSV
jgi:hypothetical protein